MALVFEWRLCLTRMPLLWCIESRYTHKHTHTKIEKQADTHIHTDIHYNSRTFIAIRLC
ncbi:hypothetical protein BDF19DRAFT_448938 [Syncephalis fuscata]|nr:hypothetical protein BDF19DRAFT_448937 [Syncephalis fuscata]KAI9593215.1 hypothetical protein BDF19DRAFT_448938 [Syncephalis fuscata]